METFEIRLKKSVGLKFTPPSPLFREKECLLKAPTEVKMGIN